MFNEKKFLENYISKGYADEVVLEKALNLYPEFIKLIRNKSKSCIKYQEYRNVYAQEISNLKIKSNEFYYRNLKLDPVEDFEMILGMLYYSLDNKKLQVGYKALLQTYEPHEIIQKLYELVGNVTTFYYDVIKIMDASKKINYDEFKRIIDVILDTYPTFIEGFLDELKGSKYEKFINDEILNLIVKKYQGLYNILRFIDKYAKDKAKFYSQLREMFLNQPVKYSYLINDTRIFNKLIISELMKIKDKMNLGLYLTDDDKKEIIKGKSVDEIIRLSIELGVDFSEVMHKNKNKIKSNYQFLKHFYHPLNVKKHHIEKALNDKDERFLEQYIKQYLLYKEGELK